MDKPGGNAEGSEEFKKGVLHALKVIVETISPGGVGSFSDKIEEVYKILGGGSDEQGGNLSLSEEESALICPATDSALQNDLILKGVFECLNLTDLKVCKQVSKAWNRISSEVIKRSKPTYISTRKLMDLKKRRERKNQFDVLKSICTSETWIALGIAIDAGVWDFSKDEVMSFLGRFGPSVKRLIIDYSAFPTFSALRELLITNLPNVEYLELRDLGDFHDEHVEEFITPLFSCEKALTSLKTLRLPGKRESIPRKHLAYLKAVKGILFGASNLKRIENFDCRFTEELIRQGKTFVVQDLNFVRAKMDRTFAGINWHLKKIEITGLNPATTPLDEKIRVANLLMDVFKHNSNTLQELRIQPMVFLPGFAFPVLPGLKRLSLVQDATEEPLAFLPHYSKSEEIFPGLKELCLDVDIWDEYTIPTYFPEETSFSQLQFLKISSCIDFYGLLLIGNFTTVTRLEIHCSDFFSSMKPHLLWSLPLRLKHLELRDFCFEKITQPDSFFTGIPTKICSNLREVAKFENMDPNIFRTKMSICNFKELQRLKLALANVSTAQSEVGTLSQVAGWYGFECLPDLAVIISYDYRHCRAPRLAAAVEGIMPFSFVTCIHEETPAF